MTGKITSTGCVQALRFLMSVAVVATIAVLPAGVAGAQTAAAATEGGGLEEIVVTARKRAESIQDIPVAVSAFSAEQIDRNDLTSIEKIAASTPQLTVGHASSGSGAQISMRGIGSTSTSIGIEQSVATVVDGAYSGQGRVIYEGFFDMDRVEVLKGPQALFFGKNATAGVISLTTADPGDKFEALSRAGYEFESKTTQLEGMVSTPITDTLGVRLAVRGSYMDGGYYTNESSPFNYATTDAATGATQNHESYPSRSDVPDERELLARLTVKWHPVDEFTATVKASIDRDRVANNSWNYVLFGCATGYTTLVPTTACSNSNFVVHDNNIPADIAAATPFADGSGLFNLYQSWGLTGTLEYRINPLTVTSITNYSENANQWECSCAYNMYPIWATEHTTWRSASNETRLLTTFDFPVNLFVGNFYSKTERIFDQNVLFAGSQNTLAPAGDEYVSYSKNSETQGKTVSPYAQVSWKFLDRFELDGGARYTHETKDSYFVQPYVNPFLTALFVQGAYVRANQAFDNVSPEATLSWKPTQTINIYGAYKTGYKSGGLSNSGIYSGLSADPRSDFVFEPEKAKGYELGIKTTSFDNQLRLNLTAYRYRYTNLQVDFFNSPTFAYITTNAGAAIAKGIETELEFSPREFRGLTLNGTLNVNHSRYQSFIGPCYAGQSIAGGCPSPTGPNGFPLQDLSGKPTSVAPNWTATLGGYYERSVNEAFNLGFGLDARYSDAYLASSFANPLSQVHTYTTLEGMLRAKTADDRWEVALIGKNLTNRQYFLGSQDASGTGSGTGTNKAVDADQAGYGTIPRTVQLQATWRYR